MSNTSSASSGGIGILGMLGVIFVTLKIIDIKPIGDWSWWLVTAPFWGGFALLGVFFVVCFVIYIVGKLLGIK